jgi:sugar/nucleoside kinase (ribokinase family)
MNMSETRFDILGIGNAIVDVLTNASEEFLTERKLDKGSMRIIDSEEAETLYSEMGAGKEASGGSAGNTIAGVASLGSRGAFVGKVHQDQLGETFAHDIRELGVHFETKMATSGPPTARCLILVTPDAQRTMNTHLGACVTLTESDVDEELVEASAITYLEGYLWDPPEAKQAFRKAMGIAHGANRKVALTLSDAFCVDRYREEFCNLVDAEADILFANEAEIISLYKATNFDEALQRVKASGTLAALTRGERGSVVVSGSEVHEIACDPVAKVVDTTGAGDQFAAGFLHGLTQGRDLPTCGRLGSLAAAEIISHYGARPETSLAQLAQEKGL